MGNQTSTLEKRNASDMNIIRLLDSIASKYILTQNFKDLQKLDDKSYCDKLTILTSNIINQRLTSMDIQYLNQRVKNGITVDEETHDNIIFLKDSDLHDLDVKKSLKKKRLCIGIARFYVRIAQLFGAIVSTINPIYTYTDANNTIQKVPFMKKHGIPKEYRSKAKVSKSGLCASRIRATMVKALQDTSVTQEKTTNLVRSSLNQTYNIQNRLCSLGKTTHITPDGATVNETKTLLNEPGIPELESLYKDVFDYNKGKYTSMSDKAKQQYEEDLKRFYKAFTGKDKPSSVKHFGDIPLRDFHNSPSCKGSNSVYNKSYKNVDITDELMETYAKSMKSMISNMNERQTKLIKILDEIFVYGVDQHTHTKYITIEKSLNSKKLEKLIQKTRQYIVNILIGCEEDFVQTLQSFDAIIEEQIQNTLKNKIENIKRQHEILLTEN